MISLKRLAEYIAALQLTSTPSCEDAKKLTSANCENIYTLCCYLLPRISLKLGECFVFHEFQKSQTAPKNWGNIRMTDTIELQVKKNNITSNSIYHDSFQ